VVVTTVPSFSVHPDELVDSTKKKLNDRAFFYANSNAGMGWTDRANREAFYRWRIIPRMLVDTNTRDMTSMYLPFISFHSSKPMN
jgi:isopentenyl diphosphate isomerase/L-lactate dehydrogenase-like FMN-dependent dehydrogenase